MRDFADSLRSMKSRLGLPLLVIVLAAGATYWWMERELNIASCIVAEEDETLEALAKVLEAQGRYLKRHRTYAWAGQLADDGLLDGMTRGEEDEIRVSDAYRIDVLLPHRAASKGAIAIAPRGAKTPSKELARKYMSLVARPLRPGVDGYRVYYVDQRGEFFAHEGVIDETTLMANRLPPFAIQHDTSNSIAGLRWVKLERAPSN